eukprot:scaffold652398_cov60-Prasinocladus_malaysianus.AAC.1
MLRLKRMTSTIQHGQMTSIFIQFRGVVSSYKEIVWVALNCDVTLVDSHDLMPNSSVNLPRWPDWHYNIIAWGCKPRPRLLSRASQVDSM